MGLLIIPLLHTFISTFLYLMIINYILKKDIGGKALLMLVGVFISGFILTLFLGIHNYYPIYLFLIGYVLYREFKLSTRQTLLLLILETAISFWMNSLFY